MSEGRILAMDTPSMALTEASLRKAYGVDVRVVEINTNPGIKIVVPSF
jgi:ABC-type hemin transport system ATPase subunit